MSIHRNRIITVASSVFNLAGELSKREDFLKVGIQGHVVTQSKDSISKTLTEGLLKGPGMRLRSFGRWARTSGYSAFLGLNTAQFSFPLAINNALIIDQLPNGPARIQAATIESGDYNFWVDQYVLTNFPDQINTAFTATFDQVANTVTITLVDLSTHTFTPAGLVNNALYLYVRYYVSTGSGLSLAWSQEQLFIYKQLSGNAVLDTLFANNPDDPFTLFPFIPIRINNIFVNSGNAAYYNFSKKATKRSLGSNLGDIINQLGSIGPSLANMNYSYIVFGVPLNTKESQGRKYIYEFFQEIMIGRTMTADYQAWLDAEPVRAAQILAWNTWYADAATLPEYTYLYAEPPRPVIVEPPVNKIQHTTGSFNTTTLNYDMTISWNSITETVQSGIGKVGAVKGDLWFEELPGTPYDTWVWVEGTEQTSGNMQLVVEYINNIKLNWQDHTNSWRSITISGLEHRNRVYGNTAVTILGNLALADLKESAFIVPLQENIFRKLPLTQATQLSTTCMYLVVNSYAIISESLISSLLPVIFVVVAMVALIFFQPWVSSLVASTLASALATGTLLGLTGTLAVVVGLAVNTIAALIISKIITAGAVAIFGEKIGLIVGAIVSFVVLSAISVQMGGGETIHFADAGGGAIATQATPMDLFTKLTSAESLLGLTLAAGRGYTGFLEASTQEIILKGQKLGKELEAKNKEIINAFEKEFGDDNDIQTQMAMSLSQMGSLGESLDTFLSRTLMTGDDISDITLNMISNFAELTLRTDLPS